MTEMIPSLFRDLWKNGLVTNDYNLKLCGAGGGGFILGHTKDLELAKKYFSDIEISPIRFNYVQSRSKNSLPVF